MCSSLGGQHHQGIRSTKHHLAIVVSRPGGALGPKEQNKSDRSYRECRFRAMRVKRNCHEGCTNASGSQFDTTPGKLLFSGKIIDVRRDVSGGYTMGSVLLAPLEGDEQDDSQQKTSSTKGDRQHMVIPFQNEYLYAAWADASGIETGDLVCTVPDLISILGQDGEAIGSQELRYGLRVSVIGMPAHPLWKTDKGLRVGGPAGFGLDIPFKGVGDYRLPRSVIEEFAV